MAGFNKVILVGNMTRDVEIRTSSTGMMVAGFGIAINRKIRLATGEERDEVCFVDCSAFDKKADILRQYTHKGSLILVEGRLKLDSWNDKTTGQPRSKLNVIVENLQLLDRRDPNAQPGGYQPQSNWGQPVGGYQPQPNSWGQPQQNFNPPQNSWGQPQQNFNQPQNGWGQPQQNFNQPAQSYNSGAPVPPPPPFTAPAEVPAVTAEEVPAVPQAAPEAAEQPADASDSPNYNLPF